MVHALHEATRVLKRGGLLIDLRPATIHRRVGVRRGTRLVFIRRMHEDLSFDRRADAAVRRVLRAGQLTLVSRGTAPCHRYMNSVPAFRDFFGDLTVVRSHAALIRRLAAVWKETPAPKRLIVTGPLKMAVMRRRA